MQWEIFFVDHWRVCVNLTRCTAWTVISSRHIESEWRLVSILRSCEILCQIYWTCIRIYLKRRRRLACKIHHDYYTTQSSKYTKLGYGFYFSEFQCARKQRDDNGSGKLSCHKTQILKNHQTMGATMPTHISVSELIWFIRLLEWFDKRCKINNWFYKRFEFYGY